MFMARFEIAGSLHALDASDIQSETDQFWPNPVSCHLDDDVQQACSSPTSNGQHEKGDLLFQKQAQH